MKLKYFVPTAIVLAGLVGATVVFANPFYTGTTAKTAIATSTLTYLTTGNATTTPIYDSYEQYGTNQTNGGNVTIPNQVAVLLQGAASSTATVVNVACEYSDDYNGVSGVGDWYQNDTLSATTTGPLNISAPATFTFTYASSTVGSIGGVVPINTNRYQKVIICPAPLRFVRAVITMTGANGSVWSAIEPLKQRN